MTAEIEPNQRISELEKRIMRLEQIILDNEDILHKNFNGFETITNEESQIIDEAMHELENNSVKSIDDILKSLE